MNFRINPFIPLLALTLMTPAWALEKPSLQGFRQEINAHRSRVLRFGLQIAEHFLGDFPSLQNLQLKERKLIIETYLSLHDLPKLMGKDELRKMNYMESKTIFHQLYDIYGVSLNSQPQFISDLNQIESQLKMAKLAPLFSAYDPAFQTLLLKELKEIEDIVDFTDTKIRRGNELGFVAKPYAAAEFFQKRQNIRAAQISIWLEETFYQKNLSCSKVHGA